MEKQNLTIVPLNDLPEALPLFGENNDNLTPFWDWVYIDCFFIAPRTNDGFHIRWHHLMIATAEMSEQGFVELCQAVRLYEKDINRIQLPPRSFMELWTVARKNSKEVQALKAAGMIEGEEDEEVE